MESYLKACSCALKLRSCAMEAPPPHPSRQERRAVAKTVARAVKKKRRIGKHQLLCPPLAAERRH